MKIEVNNDVDATNYVTNWMDLDCYYVPRVEEARRKKYYSVYEVINLTAISHKNAQGKME